MLDILENQQFSRRRMLRLGGLAPLGLSLPGLLSSQTALAAGSAAKSFGRAKRCLFLFMWGGPAHQDLWDMKPLAPEAVRGEFKPIDTSAPGVQVCEHLQHLSRHMDKLALVRSVTHRDNNHSTSAHWMMTGKKHRLAAESFGASPEDAPHIGSVLSMLSPAPVGLPTFVAMPERIATTNGAVTPGQNGGFLGKRFDPFCIDQHPDLPDFEVPSLRLPEGIDATRIRARKNLLQTLDAVRPALDSGRETEAMNAYYQQAMDLIVSPETRKAFDLKAETTAQRERYGMHTFGQSTLLAKRLLEAGVKLVTIYWHRDKPGVDTTWDTHGNNFKQLKERLIPQVDQPIAALLDDLSASGLLDDTLIVWTSEFGRTPKVNANAGRDHWGSCNSIWMAGAGIPGGQVLGESDSQAGFPAKDPVHPEQIAATVFHMLGISHETIYHDQQGRPNPVAQDLPLYRLLGA